MIFTLTVWMDMHEKTMKTEIKLLLHCVSFCQHRLATSKCRGTELCKLYNNCHIYFPIILTCPLHSPFLLSKVVKCRVCLNSELLKYIFFNNGVCKTSEIVMETLFIKLQAGIGPILTFQRSNVEILNSNWLTIDKCKQY